MLTCTINARPALLFLLTFSPLVPIAHALLCRGQAFLQIVIATCLLLLLVSTYAFQVGLIGVLIREFRVTIAASCLYFTVLLVYGVTKLVWPRPTNRFALCNGVSLKTIGEFIS